MDLINVIHAGDAEKAKRLATDSSLINAADAQGNTPLHYAVAQQDLELIKCLIEQGACTTAKNHRGETAEQWFRPLFAVRCNFNLDFFKELKRAIQCGNSQFLAAALRGGVSPFLRFSQAKTLLHLVIDYQRVASVNVLLEQLGHIAVEHLLNLEDSQGVTPLALAQKHCQLGSPVAQGIVSYLQKKRCAVAEEGTASALQTQCLPTFSFEPIGVEQSKLQALVDVFSYRCGPPDIVKLNPLRSTIVKIAHKLCYQAFLGRNNSVAVVPNCNRKAAFPIEDLFEKLFGRWMSRSQQSFEEKFLLVLSYLYLLIKPEKAEQVIEFSEELAHSGGWASPSLNKIYLNHRMKGGLMSVVVTLIHEVTHLVGGSYDFFSTVYSDTINGFSMSLKNAYQLAAKGTAGELTAEKRRLFEVRLLLEEGLHPGWKQNLHHWMALHSAETLTIAILALATLPTGFAQYESRPKPALVIKPRFLQTLCGVAAPVQPPAPERSSLFWPCGAKRHTVSSSECSDQETRPGTANSDSGISSAGSSTQMEWSETNAQASLSHLTHKMVSTPPSTTVAPPELSPEALPATQAGPPPLLAFSANILKP